MIKADKYVNCPLCGSTEKKCLYPATGRKSPVKTGSHYTCTSPYLSYHEDIVRCRNCSMVYTNPQPSPEELIKIYQGVVDPTYLEQRIAREYTFKKSLKQMAAFTPPPGKLLDIGCYTGLFLQVARQAGWQVYGSELSSWAAGIARKAGLTIFEGNIDNIKLPNGCLDALTLWDVIEHLPDPLSLLEKTGPLLKPGGLLALSTYFINRTSVRLLRRYYPFFMDMHLSHFSSITMNQFLEKCGFKLLAVKPHVRTLRLAYFLEKLSGKIPLGKKALRKIAGMKFLAGRLIRVRGLGLVNVFARRV